MNQKYFFCILCIAVISCNDGKYQEPGHTSRSLISSDRYITGILSFPSEPSLPKSEKIYFDDLNSVLIASCLTHFQEINATFTTAKSFSCVPSNAFYIVNTERPDFFQDYRYFTCTKALYTCVGYKLLELAELQSDITIEGPGVKFDNSPVPFMQDNYFNRYLSYNTSNDRIVYRDSYYSTPDVTPGLAIDAGSCTKRCLFTIATSPQKPHIRTWLYQAARDAFERAGIASVQVLSEVDGLTAVTNIIDGNNGPTPSFAEQFATEYFEVLERYTETVEKLAKHQASVGAMDSQWTDATKQQQTLWNAAENSRLAGLKTLLNDNPVDPDGNQARSLQCPTCSRKIKGNGIQRAVDFLRAGRSPLVFDVDMSTEDIILNTVKWLLWDRDGGTALPSLTGDDAVAYIRAFDFGVPEVEQAVDILREEKAAFFRVYATSEPVSGSSRIVSLMPPTSNLPPAFWQGRLQGMDTPDLQSDGVANQIWYKTKDRTVHPHRSAHEFIQYMRDGALLAVNAFGGNYESEVSKLYGKLLVMGTRQAGDRKLVLWRSGLFTNLRVHAQLQGRFHSDPTSGASERVLLVRDRNRTGDDEEHAGLWCALEGKIGGVDCTFSDYLESDLNVFTVGDGITGSPFEQALQVSGTYFDGVYHLFSEKEGRRQLLFSFNPARVPRINTIPPTPPVIYPIGGTLLDDVSELVDRDPEQCADPTTHCTGLPTNLVPPLENELTSDSDLFETSWRHYLNLATLAANEADQMGQQLVEEGLQMDMRAEEAARALEEICGGVVNVGDITGDGTTLLDAFNSSDASLENCLPSKNDTIPMVSIGPALCLWSAEMDNWCVCTDPTGHTCPVNCPVFMPSSGDCEDLKDDWSGIIFTKPIEASLGLANVVNSGEPTYPDPDDLAIIREMRSRYEESSSSGINTTDWDTLSKMTWFNQTFFEGLVSSIHMNPDPFFHYNVVKGDKVIWSTHKALNPLDGEGNLTSCPLRIPWLPYDIIDNGSINCENLNCTDLYCTYDGTTGGWVGLEFSSFAVRERIKWGSRLNDVFKTMSSLAAKPGGFSYARRGKRGSGHKTFHNEMDYSDLPYYEIAVSGDAASLDSDGRKCIYFPGDYNLMIPENLDGYPSRIKDYLERIRDNSTGRHYALFGLGGSLNNCNFYDDKIYFDDYVRHDGQELGNELFQSANKLWDDTNGLGIKWMLMNKYNPGIKMVNDIRNAECELYSIGSLKMSTGNEGEEETVPLCFNGDRLWDALEFAAFFARQIEPTCLEVQDLNLDIQSDDDLQKVSTYLRCASNEAMEKIQRTVFFNVPKKIVEKMGAGGNGQYAGVQGELLQAYMEIENALTEFTGTLKSIPEITFQMSQQVRATTLNIKGIEIAGKIDDLRRYQNLLNSTIGIAKEAQGLFDVKEWVKNPVGQVLGIGIGSLYAAIMVLEYQIGGLQDQATDVNIKIEMNALLTALGTSVSQLRTTLDTLKIKANQVNQALERLNQLRNKAEVLSARATMAGSDAAGRVYPTNTVMRRRYNTTRIRYENALKRAKKLAFIARRAIEFRLGEDLTEMTQDMTLVDAPAAWVEDLCTVTGMDYSAIRVEDEENPMPDYSGQFIGDYVKKLSDVVESYSFDFPFHDSEDVAVISLRDDIKTSVGTCLIESHNHLVYSGDLGYGEERDGGEIFGWKRSLDVCAPTTDTVMHPDEVCTWVRKDPTTYFKGTDNRTIDASSVTEGDWVPSEILNATMVMDATGFYVENTEGVMVAQARTSGTKYMGFVQQTTQVLSSGDWMLSLWYMPLKESIPGKVEIYNANWQLVATVELSDVTGPWRKVYVPFNLSTAGVVHVQIHASATDVEVPNPGAGAVEVWGLQLETLTPGMCLPDGCVTREYQATDARRLVHVAGCIDTTGESFRQQFRRGCSCLNSNPCTNQSPDIQCYWETDFVLNLADIESGKYLTSDAIAVGNYNYRHGSIAANIVGSQILSCPEGGTYQCYANGYVPYTLYHDGEVSIRNHGGWTEDFSMNQARIEHGKALAAEVVVTNPLSSQHQSLLSGFDKKEFRGRPLQGQYTLRIWETPGLQWQNLEDIQLIWRYTYWTAF